MLYLILGKLFAGILMLGLSFIIGILAGRYSSRFTSWDEFLDDLFN